MRAGEPPLRDGASEEFAVFVDRYSTSLVRLAYLLLGDSHAAEDLTADVFLAAWRQWDRISQIDYPLAYLRQMITNQAATRHRRRIRERHTLERLFATTTEFGHESDGAAVVDVRTALQRVPPRRRACLALRYAFDLSEGEVAQILGISVGAVKSQTSKGLAQLRRELGDVTQTDVTPTGGTQAGGTHPGGTRTGVTQTGGTQTGGTRTGGTPTGETPTGETQTGGTQTQVRVEPAVSGRSWWAAGRHGD